jgi:hypothetical protein
MRQRGIDAAEIRVRQSAIAAGTMSRRDQLIIRMSAHMIPTHGIKVYRSPNGTLAR